MKNAEFASARGVPAVVVSLRTACLLSAAKRDFIWRLQGLSLKDGGFKRVARELVDMFPDRLRTEDMRKVGVVSGKNYSPELIEVVEMDLGIRSHRLLACNPLFGDEGRDSETPEKPEPSRPGSYLIECCRSAALGLLSCQRDPDSLAPASIEEFLVRFCTEPKIEFSLPGADAAADDMEIERAIEANPELERYDFRRASLPYFGDFISALWEYMERREKRIRAGFQLTAVGQQIWDTLDYALASRNMVLLDGLEGRGKTEAVKAWCELHTGRARLVSLKGVTNKTTAFREIASALGIPYAYGRTGPEMQARIEDVLGRSKIMLVIDEAHFAFNQTRQMTARPELIDWIDTAVCNRAVPCALVTTPQFIACMARAKNQVGWNYNQFRRRVKRWITLPAQNTEADIAAVARSVFKDTSEAAIKKIVGYALLSKRDLSAVGDVASEVRAMLGTQDLVKVSVGHVHRAITDFLIPSDQAFKVSLAEAEAKQSKGRRRAPQLPQAPSEEPGLMDSADETAALAETLSHGRRPVRQTMPGSGSTLPASRIGGLEAVLTTP
jgi:hypothetical protein